MNCRISSDIIAGLRRRSIAYGLRRAKANAEVVPARPSVLISFVQPAALPPKSNAGEERDMIDSYRFGHIVIDGRPYTSDVIILPGRVDASWWRKQGHSLCVEDIEAAIEANPDVLVVGTGADGLMQVPESTAQYVRSRGVALIVERTDAACERYNELARSSTAVAALHLTC
jgi:hypothetical protein